MVKLFSPAAIDIRPESEREPRFKCVVRVKTSFWRGKRGVHTQRDLIFMRRLSTGINILEEDVSVIGAAEVIQSIENLHEVEDGLYEVVTCNIKTDWETGYVDDYDLKLVPFVEEPTPNGKPQL